MNRSMTTLIIFGLVLIAGFFTWQLTLHKQLEKSPTQCTGDKLFNNSCGLGSACVIPGQTASANLFTLPTSSDEALRIINDFKQIDQTTGYCIPWASLGFNLPLRYQSE